MEGGVRRHTHAHSFTRGSVHSFLTGLLSSVANLETASSTSSITVSWSAPFSLDVTGVDPDIWYSVLIYNVTDEENPTAVPCTDCHNLTQTYIFSPDYPSPCHKYTFTVIPTMELDRERAVRMSLDTLLTVSLECPLH